MPNKSKFYSMEWLSYSLSSGDQVLKFLIWRECIRRQETCLVDRWGFLSYFEVLAVNWEGAEALPEENNMCNIFANQNPERYESQTRRLRLNGQSTSIRLENSFWEIVDELAEIEGVSSPVFISKLHSEVLELHGEVPNFTSLLRCACLIHMDKTALSLDANSEEQSSALFVLASESDRVTL